MLQDIVQQLRPEKDFELKKMSKKRKDPQGRTPPIKRLTCILQGESEDEEFVASFALATEYITAWRGSQANIAKTPLDNMWTTTWGPIHFNMIEHIACSSTPVSHEI